MAMFMVVSTAVWPVHLLAIRPVNRLQDSSHIPVELGGAFLQQRHTHAQVSTPVLSKL